MPRAKKAEAAAAEAKRRSRTGCWPCKARKVKCGEEKPECSNCSRSGDTCDYSIRLNWAGRTRVGRPSSSQSPTTADRSPPLPPPPPADLTCSPRHASKRVKLSTERNPADPQPGAPADTPASARFKPHSISSIVNTPATPASTFHSGSSASTAQDPPDLPRLSVKSLLSDPSAHAQSPRYPRADSQRYRTHGYDHGLPDLDIPRNDDRLAIGPTSSDLRRTSNAVSELSSSGGEGEPAHIAFEPGGYYAHPVPIKISKSLEPLPQELLGDPINLLYFHHFINHTGRIMVPHDCPENPLRCVLPHMAVRNSHLLHLLLAFSASHRARLLDHPEPANRIAGWMTDVLPALRQSLNEPASSGGADPTDPSSLAPLATAIMLASLEIISPNTFAVPISWQDHLQVARQMIVARGGLHHLAQRADGARDKAIFFLSRWFAYLDVLGSLSGSKHDQPLYGAYLEDGGGLWLVNRDNEEIYQIDCFFGFSGRCIALLAQVAELAAECDSHRIDGATGQVKPGWQPADSVRQQAETLKQRLNASVRNVFRGCMHSDRNYARSVEMRSEQDVEEIYATNEAYHWAALIHLSRRVLGQPSGSPEVQDSVRRVISSLEKVRRGATAESCLLFPMFTAGCEAQTQQQKDLFMERLKAVEGWGMQHVRRARDLMQTVWETGRPWETLVNGEFFG